jgi:hypothetical protein
MSLKDLTFIRERSDGRFEQYGLTAATNSFLMLDSNKDMVLVGTSSFAGGGSSTSASYALTASYVSNSIWLNDNGMIRATAAGSAGINLTLSNLTRTLIRVDSSDDGSIYTALRNGSGTAAWADLITNEGTSKNGAVSVGWDDGVINASMISITADRDAGPSLIFFDTLVYDEVLKFKPRELNGSTPYVLDTSVEHTNGNLLEIKNDGANAVVFTYDGEIDIFGLDGSVGVYIQSESGVDFSDYWSDSLDIYINNVERVRLHPKVPDGTPPYIFDTSIHHATGSMVEFKSSGSLSVKIGGWGDVTLTPITKNQRNAISASIGTLVYQSDNTPGLRVYNGTSWVRFTETNDP